MVYMILDLTNLSRFTKKAANEMKERLTTMIGKEKTAQVRMGTFHALCALYIRKYAVHVGIKGNFTVCDTDEGYARCSIILTRLFICL